MRSRLSLLLVLCIALAACVPLSNGVPTLRTQTSTPELRRSTPTLAPTNVKTLVTPTQTPTPLIGGEIPNFEHIILIIFENRGYTDVIGNPEMPHFNVLAKNNILLDHYFGITHPSLPNYMALVSGSTQGISSDCHNCFVNQPNLADLIETSGRTWKTYQEDMPSSCFLGDAKPYVQKHNPLIYFDSIRKDPTRCNRSIVPLAQLDKDLTDNQLPNFVMISPNLCNSGHDCSASITDTWMNDMVLRIQKSDALGGNSLIILTFDEAADKDTSTCCGLGNKAGGQVVTILISPSARKTFTDSTPYSHFSLLKTILSAWSLQLIGQTGDNGVNVISAPWKI